MSNNVNNLVDKILACACMSSAPARQFVINKLPSNVHERVIAKFDFNGTSREQIANIVQACESIEGGFTALIASIKFFDEGTIAFEGLEQFLKETDKQNAGL